MSFPCTDQLQKRASLPPTHESLLVADTGHWAHTALLPHRDHVPFPQGTERAGRGPGHSMHALKQNTGAEVEPGPGAALAKQGMSPAQAVRTPPPREGVLWAPGQSPCG